MPSGAILSCDIITEQGTGCLFVRPRTRACIVLDEAAQKHASPCLDCPPVSKLAVACLLSVECFLPLSCTGMKGVHTHHLALALQVWVRDVVEAQQVLDYETGQRYCKLQVRIPATAWFCMSARAFGKHIIMSPPCNCVQLSPPVHQHCSALFTLLPDTVVAYSRAR